MNRPGRADLGGQACLEPRRHRRRSTELADDEIYVAVAKGHLTGMAEPAHSASTTIVSINRPTLARVQIDGPVIASGSLIAADG